MVTVVQLVERLVVVQEVAGSSPVSHPVVSHGVDGRVRKTPNMDRLARFGVFCCYHAEKWTLSEGVECCFAPGLDETRHYPTDRAVGVMLILARTKWPQRCPLPRVSPPRGIVKQRPMPRLSAS